MSDTQITEALVLRIQKMLALASHKDTPEAEAAAAAGMVQRMMETYNLSVHQLESAGTQTGLGGKREKRQHDRAAMYNHQRELMACIAKNNFCRHWVAEVYVPHERKEGQQRRAKRHMLLGRDINVKSVEMVYDYLIDTMDRLLPWQGMDKRGKDALLWLAGCTERLCTRLDDQRRQAEEASKAEAQEAAVRAKHPSAANGSGGNALVLVDVYQNEEELNLDYMYGFEPGTTTRKRLEKEAQQREFAAKVKSYQDQGYSWSDAWDMAYYGKIPERTPAVVVEEKQETDAQRRKRAEKEERQEQAYSDRAYRRQRKEDERRTSMAYRMGSVAGQDIGLDAQVTNTRKERLA